MCHALFPSILQVKTQTSSSLMTFLLNTDGPSCVLPMEMEPWYWELGNINTPEPQSQIPALACLRCVCGGGGGGNEVFRSSISSLGSHKATQNKHVPALRSPGRCSLRKALMVSQLHADCILACASCMPTLTSAYRPHATCIFLVTLCLRQA